MNIKILLSVHYFDCPHCMSKLDNAEYFENVDDDDVCHTNGIGAELSESLRVLKFLSVRVFKVQLHSSY